MNKLNLQQMTSISGAKTAAVPCGWVGLAAGASLALAFTGPAGIAIAGVTINYLASDISRCWNS